MSIVSGIFARHKTYNAVLRRLTQSVVNGVPGVRSYPIVGAAKAIYYRGSLAKSFISEKFSPDVSGVVLFDPAQISASEVPTTSGRIDICDEDSTGAVNLTAGYAAGATIMAVDGFAVQPKQFDMFFVAGDSVEHEIKAIYYTGSAVTSIAFTPALGASVTDDAVIVVTPIIERLSVIDADDVALQGAALVVPVKEFA